MSDVTILEPPDLKRGLPDGFLPLSVEEQREMLTMLREVHAWLKELRDLKDHLPEMMENLPPMARMMLGNFLK